MDASELWSDLKLGALLGNEPEEHLPLSLQAALQSGKKSKEKILLDHSKTWRKPSYNVLKDRYGSRPHDPPVLDASKLTKLADPIRGKFTSSYEKLLGMGRSVNPGDETREEDDDGSEAEQTRNYRYRNAASENTPETTANSQRRGKKMSSTSPSKSKLFSSGTRSSAFFLTAAGSDDEAEDCNVGFPGGPRYAGVGAVKSKFRGKLEEVKRNGKGIQEILSRPLLEQKRKQTQQKQRREPGLSRTKSGKFATAGAVGVNSTGKKKVNNNLSFTHIKSSIPPQQPHPRRKPLTKIFDAGSIWNSRGVAPKLPGKTMRRGAAPVDQPLGVGLDLSNVSSNGAGGGLAERRAQRLARAKVGLSGAARVAQSKDTTDIPAGALEVDGGTASGGGVNAAARIRAARAGPGRGPGGIKSAPGQLSTQTAAARPVPVPVNGAMQPRGGRVPPLAQRDFVAATALDLTSDKPCNADPGHALARRKKSVTIDPSLSPCAKDKRKLSSGPGFSEITWKGLSRSSSNREASASPRTKLVRTNSTDTGRVKIPVTSTAPVTEETDGVFIHSSLKGSAPVDMASMQSNLEKIQAREKDRMGAREAEVSAAALLMQHAKRLSSQFDKALEFSSKYNDIDYAPPFVASGKSSYKIVI